MVCSDCGYTCECVVWHNKSCRETHTEFHHQIIQEREQFMTHSSSSTSVFGSPKTKMCPTCEERYGVTDHVCKKINASIDWLDFMAKWFKDKK